MADPLRESIGRNSYQPLGKILNTKLSDVSKAAASKIDYPKPASGLPDTVKPLQNVEIDKPGFGKRLGEFMNTSAGGMLSSGVDMISNGINTFPKVDTTPMQQSAKSFITNAIGMIPGWGQAASMALKLADSIGNATGLNLDSMSRDQAQAAGINGWGRIANNIFGSLPGNFLGAFTGNTFDSYNTREAMGLSDAFGGTVDDINTAGTMGGRSYLFGRNKANSFILGANNDVDLLTNLSRTNSIRKLANGQDFTSQSGSIYGGRSMGSDRTYIGKDGLKLLSKNEAQMILQNRKFQKEVIESFQNGGVIGVDTNILPEGALHKNLNHLDDANPEVGEEVTDKGIPVIVTDNEGNIEQVAEIEKEEIILRKELTDRLEELWKQGTEEAMIWAGKLLAQEIITNTQDNTGQLDEK